MYYFELPAGGRKFSSTHNSESEEAPPLPAKASCRPSGRTVRSKDAPPSLQSYLLGLAALDGYPP